MPIAHCVLAPEINVEQTSSASLVSCWAQYANVDEQQMTINLLSCHQQIGQAYAVIATLLLPSLWQQEAINRLQLGLAKALAECLKQPVERILVITQIIESGRVVDNGQLLSW